MITRVSLQIVSLSLWAGKAQIIIEWLGLKEIIKIILFQAPHHGQECHTLDQVVQGLIQPGLQLFQQWGTHNLIGKLVPVPHLNCFFQRGQDI